MSEKKSAKRRSESKKLYIMENARRKSDVYEKRERKKEPLKSEDRNFLKKKKKCF